MGNFDSCLLVHFAHGGHFQAFSDNIVGRTVACVFGDSEFVEGSGVGGDGGQVSVATTLTARKLAVGAVGTGFTFNDEIAAGESVKNDVDESGAGDDGSLGGVSFRDPV